MIAGLNLKTDGDCQLAVFGDELEIFNLEKNMDIVEALPSEVSVMAVNAPLESGEGLSEKEEELVEEGHIFSPSTQNTDLERRAMHLKQLIFEQGVEVELVRFDPMITSKELAIDGDKALEGYGVPSGDISTADEFDAVLGAVTARFYEQDQCEDLGIQVPNPLNEKQNT